MEEENHVYYYTLKGRPVYPYDDLVNNKVVLWYFSYVSASEENQMFTTLHFIFDAVLPFLREVSPSSSRQETLYYMVYKHWYTHYLPKTGSMNYRLIDDTIGTIKTILLDLRPFSESADVLKTDLYRDTSVQ